MCWGPVLAVGSDMAGLSHSPCLAWSRWAPLSPGPGMWRWSLHKKVERDPGKSPVLVRILLRELEKVSALVERSPLGCMCSPPQLCVPKLGSFAAHLLDFYLICLPPRLM
jgi:hypothetical protein